MSIIRKIILPVLLLVLISQFVLIYIVPTSFVYNNRIVYDVVKNNVYDIETTIKAIKREIDREKLKNYIVILGDSVGYSTPCPPDKSIAFYMNSLAVKEGKDIKTFNLSVPSAMCGDFFIIMQLLKKHGISTKNLIINLCYWEFKIKTPVFWFKHYFKDIDLQNYQTMIAQKQTKKATLWDSLKTELDHQANTNIALLEYREFAIYYLKKNVNAVFGEKPPIIKPWYKKDYLPDMMKKDENKWYYTDIPFDFTTQNPQIYFLNKIMDMQKGKNTVIFLAAMNDKLIGEGTLKEGYLENMKNIDNLFKGSSVTYINYNKKIDYNLFSDHVHLIPEGYKLLADDLWKKINDGGL